MNLEGLLQLVCPKSILCLVSTMNMSLLALVIATYMSLRSSSVSSSLCIDL